MASYTTINDEPEGTGNTPLHLTRPLGHLRPKPCWEQIPNFKFTKRSSSLPKVHTPEDIESPSINVTKETVAL